ncbi:MAG: hypothetical protein H7A23_16835 [Leptospiraceae bacterium]|nr:hypothetical protein [Leptospiraceae bacterium]MCP5496213.1 hypothetical protein [Leptospiraceae bacterium]
MKFKVRNVVTMVIFILFGLMDTYCVDDILYKFGEPDEELKDLINPSRKRFMYNSDCDPTMNKEETRKSLNCDSFLILKNYFCAKGKADIIPYLLSQ